MLAVEHRPEETRAARSRWPGAARGPPARAHGPERPRQWSLRVGGVVDVGLAYPVAPTRRRSRAARPTASRSRGRCRSEGADHPHRGGLLLLGVPTRARPAGDCSLGMAPSSFPRSGASTASRASHSTTPCIPAGSATEGSAVRGRHECRIRPGRTVTRRAAKDMCPAAGWCCRRAVRAVRGRAAVRLPGDSDRSPPRRHDPAPRGCHTGWAAMSAPTRWLLSSAPGGPAAAACRPSRRTPLRRTGTLRPP
jgi:hypothetical protein